MLRNPILVDDGVVIHKGTNSSYYYLVYKITNLVNGHIYVGVHATTEPFDDYMGSGYSLRLARKKYGA